MLRGLLGETLDRVGHGQAHIEDDEHHHASLEDDTTWGVGIDEEEGLVITPTDEIHTRWNQPARSVNELSGCPNEEEDDVCRREVGCLVKGCSV